MCVSLIGGGSAFVFQWPSERIALITRIYSILPLAAIACAAPFLCHRASGQTPALPLSTAATQPIEQPPAGLTHEEVRTRLEAVRRVRQAVSDAGDAKPGQSPDPELELLEQLDRSFEQLDALKKAAEELAASKTQFRTELETLRVAGPSEKRPNSFLLLEAVRSELQAHQARGVALDAARAKVPAELERARKALEEAERRRRQAKEALDTLTDATLRPARAGELRVAELANEAARLTVQLRERERSNLQLELEAFDLRKTYLEEKAAWIEARAVFAEEDLNEQIERIARQELSTKRALESAKFELEAAAQRLANVRQRRDQTPAPSAAMNEELEAARLDRETRQLDVTLLGERLERLATARQLWIRRYRTINDEATPEELGAWQQDTTSVVRRLEASNDLLNDEVAQLRNTLLTLQQKLDSAGDGSPEAVRWLQRQRSNVQDRIAIYESAIARVAAARQLADKLIGDIQTRRNRLSLSERFDAVWDAVVTVWNYEIAAVEDRPITVRKIVIGLLLLVAGVFLSRLLCAWLARRILPHVGMDEGVAAAVRTLLYYTFLLLFGLLALKIINVPLTAFTLLGGALAIGLGFGSQNLVNNFISGVILLVERPIRVGDLIEVEDLLGVVEHIGLRSTRVKSPDNMDIIVPNSSFLEKNVVNWTLSDDRYRTCVTVGVVYGSPTRDVARLIRRAVDEHGKVLDKPDPIVLFKDFGDSALIFEVHFWIRMRRMMDRRMIESDIRYRIDGLFRDAGIVIAFPQRDVHLDSARPVEVHLVEEKTEPPAGEEPSNALEKGQ